VRFPPRRGGDLRFGNELTSSDHLSVRKIPKKFLDNNQVLVLDAARK
jgi:hypothetical protein